ncbi:sphingomyelin phosphodiesterase 4 [Cloeon dipterum]|uniref:sphingomyelin phosphodiesterase 4 n=1 Tax=Cloeon dipterum TaxID=197152 RepID=UPI00321FB5ED
MRNDVVSFRVQQILNQPVLLRCQELTNLFNEVDSKLLKECYPVILENIFGSPGWGLRITDRNVMSMEKEAAFKFLDPMGPLFGLTYKLCSDFYLKYELPLSLLPAKLTRDLEKGVLINSWYCERIFVDPQTRRATALKLNPFELLIFRFALHLIPHTQRDVWLESMYLQLVERYLCHFLPCQLQSAPVEPHVPYTPLSIQGACLSQPSVYCSPVSKASLLKPAGTFNQSSGTTASLHSQHNPLAEIWRTVHIIHILMDVWLSYDDEKSSLSPCLTKSSSVSSIPSAEHARMVRAFLKHLHYFSNSACSTNPSDMDEMKRMVIPMYKSKIYHFLSGCIKSWPYDHSFRIIMEAWLSYIQPWRYTNYANYGIRENHESGKPVDRRWLTFIAEHLPFYGCIFEQILRRLSRIDLSILKNAIMLHRVCRLISLEQLKSIISEAEESLKLKSVVSPNSRYIDTTADNPAGLKIQVAAQSAISELEGQMFVYKPMFSHEITYQVRHFLREVAVSRTKAESLFEEQKKKPRSVGFWAVIFGFDDEHAEEYTVDDRRRVVDILKNCYVLICSVFEIRDMEAESVSDILNRSTFSPDESSLGASRLFDSPSGVSPVVPKPSGDPEKRPICSYEIAWLVRMFHDISSHFNREYHFEIQSVHTREDLVGRVARQVLQPPTTISVYERNREGYKVRTEKVLPARLSLRGLANAKLLFWLVVSCILAALFGFHYITGLCVPFLAFCAYIFVAALRD